MELISMGELDSYENRDVFFRRTRERTLSPEHVITVPEGVTAEIYSEGELKGRIRRSCSKRKLTKALGAEMLGKSYYVLFIRHQNLPVLSWGIGNLPIEFSSLSSGETYRVGASGKLTAEVCDFNAFSAIFGEDSYIYTSTMATEQIIIKARAIVEGILSTLFSEAGEPVVNADFMLGEMNMRLTGELCGKEFPELPGIRIKTVNVGSICVCDEDIQSLRKSSISRSAVRRRASAVPSAQK